MTRVDRNKERQAKQAEREMPDPDTSNVVEVPRTLKDLRALAGYEFKDFDTVPGSEPAANPDEPATEGDEEDPTLQKLISQMNLGGKAEDGPDEGPEKEKVVMATKTNTPDIPDIEELRGLFADTERKKAERLAAMQAEQQRLASMQAKAPDTLAFLDEKVFPARAAALSENDMETVTQLDQIIARARKNVEVTKALDERQNQTRQEVTKAAMLDDQARMAALYADLPDDTHAEPYPDGTPKKRNSPTAALDSTKKKGDSALLVVRFPEGTIVPTGKGGYKTTEHEEAVQIQITVDKVERADDTSRVFRQAKVTKETKGLNFRQVRAHRDADPGVFNFIPPYFTRKDEQDRRNDPFDAIKYGVYLPHKREYDARRQEERFEDALSGANLTATQLLLEDAVGAAVVESTWVVKVPGREYPRYLRVVLARDEEDGPVHVVAWGPPAGNRFSPRLNSIQPRKDSVIPLTVEARVEEKEGGTTAFVRFSTVDNTLTEGQDDRAKNVTAALRDLGSCSRQALLDEHAARTKPDHGVVPDEANPPADDETDHDGEPHRHYWRVNNTCRCGEKKPE